MDVKDTTSSRLDASRPIIGFPFGSVLLIISIFLLSGIFSCCYHWDKLRSLRRSTEGTEAQSDASHSPSKLTPDPLKHKDNLNQSLSVVMPGDQIPKYIAWPCSLNPSPMPTETIKLELQSPSSSSNSSTCR